MRLWPVATFLATEAACRAGSVVWGNCALHDEHCASFAPSPGSGPGMGLASAERGELHNEGSPASSAKGLGGVLHMLGCVLGRSVVAAALVLTPLGALCSAARDPLSCSS